jgi:hypothetical protein
MQHNEHGVYPYVYKPNDLLYRLKFVYKQVLMMNSKILVSTFFVFDPIRHYCESHNCIVGKIKNKKPSNCGQTSRIP